MAAGSVFDDGGDVLGSPLTLFIVQLLLIVAFSRVLGILIKPLKQPLVIAEVVAGILLGPSALSKDARFHDRIFPASSLTVLSTFANVGLILFLFIIGLEADLAVLTKSSKSSVAISITGIVLPFGLGCGIANYMFGQYAAETVPRLSFVLFIGVAMSITAFPVLARILTERKLLGTSVGLTTLGAAAIDDIVAWCILALVVSIVRASNKLSALYTVLSTIGLLLFLFLAVRPVAQKLVQKGYLTNQNGISHSTVVLAFLLMFLFSWMTEFIGIHAIFGGFAFGLAVPRQNNIARSLCEKIEDLVVTMFLPLYFTLSGLRTDLGLISSAKDGGVVVLIICMACLGKFGGCTLASRVCGHGWRDSFTVGVLMNTKGLVEVVVLNVGLDNNVITPQVFTMCVVMALVTTFMTTPICAVIYPRRRIVNDAMMMASKRHEYVDLERLGLSAEQRRSGATVALEEASMARGLLGAANQISVVAWYKSYTAAFNLMTVCATLFATSKKTITISLLGLVPLSERPSSYMRYLITNNTAESDPFQSYRSALMERAAVLGIGPRTEAVTFASTETVDDVCESVATKKTTLFMASFEPASRALGSESQVDLSYCGPALSDSTAASSLAAPTNWLPGLARNLPFALSADPSLSEVLKRVVDDRDVGVFLNRGLGSFIRKVVVPFGSFSPSGRLAVRLASMMAKSEGTDVVVVLVNSTVSFAATDPAPSEPLTVYYGPGHARAVQPAQPVQQEAGSGSGSVPGFFSKLLASDTESQRILEGCSLRARSHIKVIHNDASVGPLHRLIKEGDGLKNDVLMVVPADTALGNMASYVFSECPFSVLLVSHHQELQVQTV